jgi:hypothetical protein
MTGLIARRPKRRLPNGAALAGCALFLLGLMGETAAAANDIAVIIGNQAYPPNPSNPSNPAAAKFAHRDADAIKTFVTGKLGYLAENVIDVRDATTADMVRIFGSDTAVEAELWRRLDPAGGSNIFIYYSGRGATGRRDRQAYLSTIDGDPTDAENGGYSLARLFRNLSQLPAASIRVFLETDFRDPRTSVSAAMPSAGTAMSVLVATQRGQSALPDNTARLGLFTRRLLDALKGVADGPDYGDSNGVISLDEIKAYLDHRLSQSARRRFGQDQRATLLGLADAGIYAYRSAPSANGQAVVAARSPSIIDGIDAAANLSAVSALSEADICVFATKQRGAAWETVGAEFRKYIAEAGKRGMDLKKCTKLLANIQKMPLASSHAEDQTPAPAGPKNSKTPFDGVYKIVAQCSGVNDWNVGAIVTDGVMIIRGRTGWKIEGKFNDAGEIILTGTVHTTDRESLNFWAEAKLANGQLDGHSIFTGQYAPVSCSFNGDRL